MIEAGSDLDHYGPYNRMPGDPRNPPTPEDIGWLLYECSNCDHSEWIHSDEEQYPCECGARIKPVLIQPLEMNDDR